MGSGEGNGSAGGVELATQNRWFSAAANYTIRLLILFKIIG